MKRMLVLLLIALQISLGGCSLAIDNVSADNIETLKGWSFQYNSGTNDYSLFFGLLNERHLRQKATIISTNLGFEELRDRYSDRVHSRITSNYALMRLSGQDIRISKKLSGKLS